MINANDNEKKFIKTFLPPECFDGNDNINWELIDNIL